MPLIYEGDACVHAMLRVLLNRGRGRYGYGCVKGVGRRLTCNTSCIHLVGDVDGVDVTAVTDVIDISDAEPEIAPRMGLDNRR
jgi:hypothetical protein